ncbi:MAG: zinc-finger domain-containing protein [Geminicoccaceae bacterium]
MNVKVEIIKVDSNNIACDGGGGQLGHPRVYLAIGDDQRATCPYCGQIFSYERENDSSGH